MSLNNKYLCCFLQCRKTACGYGACTLFFYVTPPATVTGGKKAMPLRRNRIRIKKKIKKRFCRDRRPRLPKKTKGRSRTLAQQIEIM